YLPNKISKIIRKIRRRYLPDTVKGLFPYIDYFCFWNKKDYDLLTYFYKYPIKYKYFAYSANCPGENPTNLFPLKNKLTDTIMINHQASLFGNHDTIFSKLKEIDQKNHFIKLVPLSYGSTIIRSNVFKLGNKLFGHKFKPILNYMQRDEYFNMLKSIDIAIFGQRRQEASGNIIQLLKNGVKVFLRNDNNLLEYYRQKGYIIFSFEDDLIDLNSLKSLTLDEKEHNRKCYLSNLVYYDDFMPNFFLEE
ncbi:MAG: hypothetical protein K2G52_01590, partial [Muribaculaceae bacterium]|nr:hypothetical protein [Muribaculaceae bacterium]